MRALVSAACVLVLAAASGSVASRAPAATARPGAVSIRKLHVNQWYAHHTLHADIEYPQVVGMADRELQARINRVLLSAYPAPHGLKTTVAETIHDVPGGKLDHVNVVDGSYTIHLNRDHLLSVEFTGYWDPGESVVAHGDLLSAGVTLDTRTGRPYRLSDLFAGEDWREKLDHIIVRNARRITDDKLDPDSAVRVEDHNYWYYLTPRTIVFFDIGGSWTNEAEARVPYAQVRALMNPKGPLPQLLK